MIGAYVVLFENGKGDAVHRFNKLNIPFMALESTANLHQRLAAQDDVSLRVLDLVETIGRRLDERYTGRGTGWRGRREGEEVTLARLVIGIDEAIRGGRVTGKIVCSTVSKFRAVIPRKKIERKSSLQGQSRNAALGENLERTEWWSKGRVGHGARE